MDIYSSKKGYKEIGVGKQMTNFIHTRKCKECGNPVDTEVCMICRERKKRGKGDGRI